MSRRITHFFQSGFATKVDGQCYLVKKVPGGYANKEVTGVDNVIGWFPQPSCADGAITMQAANWGLGALGDPRAENGWNVSHVCGTSPFPHQKLRMRHERYAEEFVAFVSPQSGRWEADVKTGDVADCVQPGPATPPPAPPPPTVPYTAIDRNIDWRIATAIALTIGLTIYIAYQHFRK